MKDCLLGLAILSPVIAFGVWMFWDDYSMSRCRDIEREKMLREL